MIEQIALQKKTGVRLGDRLLSEGLIDERQLRQALDVQRSVGGFIGEILVASGAVSIRAVRCYLEEVSGFPFIDVSEEVIDPELAGLLSETFVLQNMALPVKVRDGQILVAMIDPLDLAILDNVKAALPRPIIPCLAFSADLKEAIRRTYDVRYKAHSVLNEIGSSYAFESETPHADLVDRDEDAPIVRLVNSILSGAMAVGASDVHVEPQEEHIRIRYRIDGIVYEQMTLPSHHLAACVSRLKVMSGIDIAERRRPQDGRFSTRDERGVEFDSRVSTIPTPYGEKVCMRLLKKATDFTSISQLGFFPDQCATLEKLVRRPHGLILVTGPTGSGKSTTLYAALQSVNDPSRNINTIEDPIEYKIAGISQMQVNPKIDLTFASGLRALVRQDPDIILVGEIRDADTADIAIQAALTGHLVLSSLHTNDAPSAFLRLQNMGVEPFLVSSALVGVMGQRLLRTLCPHCKVVATPTPEEAAILGIDPDRRDSVTIATGAGCKRCSGRGTVGRVAAAEIFTVTDTVRDALFRGVSGDELKALVTRAGMTTMREAAVRRVLDHHIPISEILRVFAED